MHSQFYTDGVYLVLHRRCISIKSIQQCVKKKKKKEIDLKSQISQQQNPSNFASINTKLHNLSLQIRSTQINHHGFHESLRSNRSRNVMLHFQFILFCISIFIFFFKLSNSKYISIFVLICEYLIDNSKREVNLKVLKVPEIEQKVKF